MKEYFVIHYEDNIDAVTCFGSLKEAIQDVEYYARENEYNETEIGERFAIIVGVKLPIQVISKGYTITAKE